jgi:hypothetical protein
VRGWRPVSFSWQRPVPAPGQFGWSYPVQARHDGDAPPGCRAYLAGIGASGTVSVAGNLVTVTVSITQPMQILDAAGLSAITVHATARAVPDRGITAISGEFANSEGSSALNPRVVVHSG